MKRHHDDGEERQLAYAFDGSRKASCTATPSGSTSAADIFSRKFTHGISLDGLRHIARDFTDGQTWEEALVLLWGHQCLPEGWTKEDYFITDQASDGTKGALIVDRIGPTQNWAYTVYKHASTGEKITRTTEDLVGPPACKALFEARPDLHPYLGTPTHFLSHPWRMKIDDVIEAAARAVSNSSTTVFFWIDILFTDFNGVLPSLACRLPALQKATKSMHVVQVSVSWNDPERMRRLWLMYESCFAVAAGQELTFAYTAAQESDLADQLRDQGPNAILAAVYAMDVNPEGAWSHGCPAAEAAAVLSCIHGFIQQVGGTAEMVVKLCDLTRRTYASVIERELERRWPVVENAVGDLEVQWQILDLAHQLACLWALTDAPDRAEALFRRTLARLGTIAPPPTGGQSAGISHIARMDRTSAELLKLLRQGGQTEGAHQVELGAGDSGELAVSWEGISVEFLEQFVREHRQAIEFLSTDAVVERILKPSTHSGGVLFPPVAAGKALIEMAHHRHKGAPKFFLSHAWRQTFSVTTSEHRGGLVQAIIHSIPESERSSTYFWCDILCVNQHLRSPHGGGLLAFAFEPLRNAMLGCDHVKVFLEHWDDPAPLSRVWCLDELRNALLLGLPVEVLMPPQAMQTFRQRAGDDPGKAMEDIQRVVDRIDIKHASATFQSDREFVFRAVETTMGCDALNIFCKEIFRDALTRCAGITPDTTQREHNIKELLAKMRTRANETVDVAQRIEIMRAVAMMQMRLWQPNSDEYKEGALYLREVATMVRRFYGPGCGLLSDISRQL